MSHVTKIGSSLYGGGVVAMAVAMAAVIGCSSAKEVEPDCVPAPTASDAPAKKKVEKFGLRIGERQADPDQDWCRACVMSPAGFASCQKVYSDAPGEDQEKIKAKAREKACADAKFKAGECPDSAIISLFCRGEEASAGTKTPGKALQDLFGKPKTLREMVPPKLPEAPKKESPAPPSDPK